MLRRFYAVAEEVLFPKAMIDKLIGDGVMALYLPFYVAKSSWSPDAADRRTVATLMLEHARGLLEGLGYGGPGAPCSTSAEAWTMAKRSSEISAARTP